MKSGVDSKTYAPPSTSQIGAVIVDGNAAQERSIVVRARGGRLQKVYDLHPLYDALSYPLLLGFNLGWSMNIPHQWGNRSVTLREFYTYYLHQRIGVFNPLLNGARLFQQYIVDQYCKVEMSELRFIRGHQTELRADAYSGLFDAVTQSENIDANSLGRRVILPSSFTRGPRAMHQLFQDSMCVIRKYGKPDLFITMTCNPQWKDLKIALNGAQAVDRPDITTRVFREKCLELKSEIVKKGILGNCVSYVYVCEFQKRGLPHIHMLVMLSKNTKIDTVSKVNGIISAELPDKSRYPQLFNTVSRCMMHGPCGVLNSNCPCMMRGKCKYNYPKPFKINTEIKDAAYPEYRRRDDGKFVMKGNIRLDNRWVVPYNPYLCKKYNCHINVEVCSSIESVKYFYKYVYKGFDRARIELTNDETKAYIEGRYVCASEAAWRLYKFRLHGRSHAIERLPCHLPCQQQVYFNNQCDVRLALSRAQKTKLTAFFDLCDSDDNAKELLYHDIPEHYVWNKKNKEWQRRKRQTKVIGRIYASNPSEGERFYLRVLLLHVPGPVSFNALRTFRNNTHTTFKAACIDRGLLADDSEWTASMRNARLHCMPKQLRSLFAIILIWGEPHNPKNLFLENFQYLSEDYRNRYEGKVNEDVLLAHVLQDISDILIQHGKDCSDFCLPVPTCNVMNNDFENSMVMDETTYNEELLERMSERVHMLNDEQLTVYKTVMNSIENRKGLRFFLDGPAGTGKTYLLNTILSSTRRQGKIALAVSSSGITAILLQGGQTAHSYFKIPINIQEHSTCNIPLSSKLAELIRKVSLIVWDEAPMMHKRAVNAVDRTIQDICKTSRNLGDITVLFSGDFRQTLPVIPRASKIEIIYSTIKNSMVWKSIQHLRLRTNMRLQSIRDEHSFLLNIGYGKVKACEHGQEMIELPDDIILSGDQTIDNLIHSTFGDMKSDCFADKAILCPLNREVSNVNRYI